MERWYIPTIVRSDCVVAVIAVETHGAGSFYASHVSGKHVSIPKIDTIAKSLGAKKISKITFNLSRQHPGLVQAILVSDAQAADSACRLAGISKRGTG